MKRILTAIGLTVLLGVSSGAFAQPARPQPTPQPMRPRPLPPGARPLPPPRPAPVAAEKPELTAAEKDAARKDELIKEAAKENAEHPRPINWYQGILGVNNDKAINGSGLDKLFWRYHDDKNEDDERNQDPPLLAQVFNFGILAWILVRFGKKPILDGLADRKKKIMGDVDAAETLRADAEKRLKSYEKQFAHIDEHRVELEEEYRAQSQNEQKRILAEADEKRARMIKDAELRVSQELRQAQGELLREAVEAAVTAAEELLKKKVEQRDLDRLADDYLTGLGSALSAKSADRPVGGAS